MATKTTSKTAAEADQNSDVATAGSPADDQVQSGAQATSDSSGAVAGDAAATSTDPSASAPAIGEALGSSTLVEAIEVKTAHGVDSFWRSGLKFGQEVKTVLLSDLTALELAAIQAEQKLVHKLVTIEQTIKDVL